MFLVLLTLGLIAQQMSPSGSTLHVVGTIDIVTAFVILAVYVIAAVLKASDSK